MITRKIPQSINVVVNSVKEIKQKKNECCKFQVVFGVSKKKFQTDVVEDFHGCPIFNTEAEIPISLTDTNLKLKLVEKVTNEVLSKMVVSLLDIPYTKSDSSFNVAMKNKGGDLVAEIHFNAYVSSFESAVQQSLDSSLNKSTLSLGISKLKDKFGLLKRNDSNPNMLRRATNPRVVSGLVSEENALKISSSCTDLSNIKSPFGGVEEEDEMNEEKEGLNPEVSGVSPREGGVEGGTRLVIRGRNLGTNKDDIVGLFICGSNVLSTLQYFSPAKIACITKAWKPGEGNISVETQSGGVGVCLVKFTFVDSQPPKLKEENSDSRRQSTVSITPFKEDQPQEDQPITMHAQVMPPEVTGVSPNEGAYNEVTKVTIRGSHLGYDAEDVLKIMICGKDWRQNMDEHKATKIVCRVGPVLKASRGEILVETASGGVGCSTVEFKLVDRRSGSEKMNCSGKRRSYGRQHHLNPFDEPDDLHSSFDTSPTKTFHNSLFSTPTSHHTSTSDPFNNTTNPFALDCTPYALDDVKHDGAINSNQNIPNIAHGDSRQEEGIKSNEVKKEEECVERKSKEHDNGVQVKNKEQKRITFPATSHDTISKPPIGQIQPMMNHSVRTKEKDDLICKMEAKLKLRETEIEKLVASNRELREEVGRLKTYIENLLNKAILHCPSILAIQ